MNERIKELRKFLNLTQQDFADKIGIKRNTISTYEIGRNEPIDAVISLICREFNVNEEWLRFGKGDMFFEVSRDEEIASFIGNVQSLDDDFKKNFISMLAKLDESEWALLEGFAKKLQKEKD